MRQLFLSIFEYSKQPRLKQSEHISIPEKMGIVIQCVVLSIIIGLCMGIPSIILEQLGLYSSDSHKLADLFKDNSALYIIFAAVVMGPIVEEIIFRGPLVFIKKKYFKIGFYTLAFLFGYLHIFNFDITPKLLLMSPILLLPQLVLGFVFGYIRVRLGLIYSIALHMCYNGVLTIPAVLALS